MEQDPNELAGPPRQLVMRRIDALWDVDTPVVDTRQAKLLTWQIVRIMSRDFYLLTACMNYRCRNPRHRDDIEEAFQRLHRVVESLEQRSADLPMPLFAVHSEGIVKIRTHEALRLFGIFAEYDRLLYKIGRHLPREQMASVFSGFTHALGRLKIAAIPNHGNPDVPDTAASDAQGNAPLYGDDDDWY